MKTRKEKLDFIRTTLTKHLKNVAVELEKEDINFLFGTLDSKNSLGEDLLTTSILVIDKEKVMIAVEGEEPVRDRLLYTITDTSTKLNLMYGMARESVL